MAADAVTVAVAVGTVDVGLDAMAAEALLVPTPLLTGWPTATNAGSEPRSGGASCPIRSGSAEDGGGGPGIKKTGSDLSGLSEPLPCFQARLET